MAMKREEANQRVSGACDKIRRAGYGMLAHTVWVWWRNVADPTYVNNVLDVEREADRLAERETA
jgi:hypothetical protein